MRLPQRPIPAPLCGSETGSFAEHTITRRLPDIGQRLFAENTFSAEVSERLKGLLAEIPHGMIQPISDPQAPDMPAWQHHSASYTSANWLQVPWFFAETYFYRRIIAAIDYFHTGLDPFAYQKQQSLTTTLARIRTLAAQVQPLVAAGWHPESFISLLLLALWGNQADMSLWSAHDASQPSHNDVASQQAHLLVNDAPGVARLLARATCPRVDIILDNAGFELMGDLCLADYLLSTGHISTVVLHTKLHPTFVSDATSADVQHTIAFLASDADAGLRAMGMRLQTALEDSRLHLQTHPFWTSPLPLWHIPDDLVQALAAATLVISKGDANYRRALGDAHWPYDTPFAEIVSYFPVPIVFLRTCKAEVMAGLAPGQAEELAQRDPHWLVNGEWGVMQCSAS